MPGATPAAALPPPDFAIVGARKCGTTALYSYLATHPGIAMSARKEPCFWSRDLDAGWGIRSRAAYDAIARAHAAALAHPAAEVPLHLRNAPTKLMRELQYGEGYEWEAGFEHPEGFLPPELKRERFYRPKP